GCTRGSSRWPLRRARSDPRRSPPPCRTRPARPQSGYAPSPVPKTPRAPTRSHRPAACRRRRTCTARPGRAAGRRRAAAAPLARRRAGARRVARAQSGWLPACGYIYLWRDSHGSRRMSIRLLALIPVAAAISLALSAAVDAVALPLFLDTTGTILATALAGPGVGIATGVVTSAVNTLRNPTFWPFVVVQIIVALYAWAAARAGLFRSFRTAVPARRALPLGAPRHRRGVTGRRLHPFTLLAIAGALPALAWILPAPAGGACTAAVALVLTASRGLRRGLWPAVLTAAPFWVFLRLLHDVPTTIAIGLRITTMVASFVWLAATLAPDRLVEATVARGWSVTAAYLFAATITAVPMLRGRARRIVEAQRCRGLSPRGSLGNRLRALRALALPLVLSALHDVDERALALETRGMVSGARRTPLAPPPDSAVERAARWALLVACVAGLIWRLK